MRGHKSMCLYRLCIVCLCFSVMGISGLDPAVRKRIYSGAYHRAEKQALNDGETEETRPYPNTNPTQHPPPQSVQTRMGGGRSVFRDCLLNVNNSNSNVSDQKLNRLEWMGGTRVVFFNSLSVESHNPTNQLRSVQHPPNLPTPHKPHVGMRGEGQVLGEAGGTESMR